MDCPRILTSDADGFLGQVISDQNGAYSFASLSTVASLVLASGVPEPSEWYMTGAGIVAILLLRRVNRSKTTGLGRLD